MTHEALGVTEILMDLAAKRPSEEALNCRSDVRLHRRDGERPEARAQASTEASTEVIVVHADSA